jgi:hypothetical protein
VLGCDVPPESAPRDGPHVVASIPADGDENVDRAATFRAFFDRPVLVRDVNRANVTLTSGAVSAFLGLSFDPVDRLLRAENLGEPLDPTVVWELQILNVRDLDRAPMPETFSIAFTTGVDAIGEAPAPPVSFSSVAAIFTEHCASAGCHVGPTPVLGLDLSSAAAVVATAINVPAEQTRVGVQEADPWHGTSTLAGLARIDVEVGVGRPAASYLVYKVLGDPHAWGSQMPPAPGSPLSHAELSLLSQWIGQGAPTD